MDDFLNILKQWQDNVAKPFVYENICDIFPQYQFRRLFQGDAEKDHWASRYKLDKSIPKVKQAEKTVIYRKDLHFREQGRFMDGVGMIDLYMSENGFSDLYKAYQDIDRRFNLHMPTKDSPELRQLAQERVRRSALLDDLLDYFAWNLENNSSEKAKAARSYLTGKRGFTKEQISKLNLGFVPEWGTVMKYIVSKKKHTLEDLEAVCEVRNSEGKTSVGRTHTLAIPYECAGVLKGFIFRRVGEGSGPKYIASQNLDRKSALFNIAADPDPKEIIVVEGEFDALKATAEGIENVVAIGGSEFAGERRSQVEDALLRRGVQKITLCLDLDAEKDDPTVPKCEEQYHHIMRSIHTIKDVNIDFDSIYIAEFPSPSDPDEYIREHGAEAFRELINSAVPYWEYIYRHKNVE